MPFTKGTSGNPSGAKRGIRKDSSEVLNQKIKSYLEKNFDTVFSCDDGLSSQAGRETARIYCELLKYSMPRFGPKNPNVKFEKLSNEQLDEIIKILQHNAPKGTLSNLTW